MTVWNKLKDTLVWMTGLDSANIESYRFQLQWKRRAAEALLQAPQGTITDTDESLISFWDSKGIYDAIGLSDIFSVPISVSEFYATCAVIFALDYQLGNTASKYAATGFLAQAIPTNTGGLILPMPRCDTSQYTDCNQDPNIQRWKQEFQLKIQKVYDVEVKPNLSDQFLKDAMGVLFKGFSDKLGIYIKAAGTAQRIGDIVDDIPKFIFAGFLAYKAIDIIFFDD